MHVCARGRACVRAFERASEPANKRANDRACALSHTLSPARLHAHAQACLYARSHSRSRPFTHASSHAPTRLRTCAHQGSRAPLLAGTLPHVVHLCRQQWLAHPGSSAFRNPFVHLSKSSVLSSYPNGRNNGPGSSEYQRSARRAVRQQGLRWHGVHEDGGVKSARLRLRRLHI